MRRLWPLVPLYLALLLWVDRGVTLHGQYVLGALTWLVLIAAAWTGATTDAYRPGPAARWWR